MVFNPTKVAFQKSPDHEIVEKYVLRVFEVSAPTSSIDVDLGIPTPDVNGQIVVTPAVFATLPLKRIFAATVVVSNAQGFAISEQSELFSRGNTAPRASGKPLIS